MPLPFLKHKEASVSAPVEHIRRDHDEDSDHEYDMLESAAEELISAVHAKDVKAVCTALRSAFEMLEKSPHEEGEHI